ncbi:hypothetical protein GCM10010228_03780 [Streptomyces massasporeus]|nr:hypothetical protein GCM10010228_03780 [Streptomyces massasporeus]
MMPLQVTPEPKRQRDRERLQRREVEPYGPMGEVGDQEIADRTALQFVAVDKVCRGELPGTVRDPEQRVRCVCWKETQVA